MKPAIPYEEIDVEIRRLVRLVNAVPGIQSISSCAGHVPVPEYNTTKDVVLIYVRVRSTLIRDRRRLRDLR